MRKLFGIACLLAVAVLLLGCVEHQGATLAEQALSKKDPSLCNTLKEEQDKTECFVVYSTKSGDPKVCLQSTASQEECISQYTIKTRNMVACDLLTDPAKKYTCIAKFTGDTTGRALEVIISDWKTNGLVSKCLEQCKKEGITCREGCIETEKPEIAECKKFDFMSNEYASCVGDADRKKRACLDACNEQERYTCEPPCKEQAEGK